VSYSIDTSALMDAWVRYYPPDVFPRLWEQLAASINDGLIVATEEVYRELQQYKGELSMWVGERRQMFISIDEQVQAVVQDIMTTHPNLVDENTGKSGADPFVIALARVRGLAVVSAERSKPSKPKIPDVCTAKGVRHITLVELFREQKWRFG
jgi:uncharacterized protein DUF4411